MATIIEQQTVLDESLVPSMQRIHWHYVRDNALFSTIKVVSRHQTAQQYGAILPIELTTAEIRNSKAYKEYHACAMGEAAPKAKASARKKKGDSASSTTPPTSTPTTIVESAPRLSATTNGKQHSRATTPVEPTDIQRTEAEQLKIVLKRSRQETHISQQSGSSTDEGTGSKPGVSNVPSDDSEEERSWKSSDDEDVGSHEEGKESDESDDDHDEGSDNDSNETVKSGAGKDDDDDDDEDDDDNDEEEELAKDDEEDTETGKGSDEEESNDEEEQESRLSEEARIQEEEDADELYRDVNINQGRGLQVTQNVEDTHVTLTPVNHDGPQESSSMSSFVSSMLNPISDVGVESIFMTTSSSIVSFEIPTPIMTPSTIATITTSGEAPIPPPTIPSIILENLPTFNSAFRFEERLRLLETSFSEYRQTNQFANTDWLQDSLQRENDEFLRNIDENMKKVLKGLVKNQVKEQVSRILPQIEESVKPGVQTTKRRRIITNVLLDTKSRLPPFVMRNLFIMFKALQDDHCITLKVRGLFGLPSQHKVANIKPCGHTEDYPDYSNHNCMKAFVRNYSGGAGWLSAPRETATIMRWIVITPDGLGVGGIRIASVAPVNGCNRPPPEIAIMITGMT
nr:hypothetical protein [Tanacetum cinerariifolium]